MEGVVSPGEGGRARTSWAVPWHLHLCPSAGRCVPRAAPGRRCFHLQALPTPWSSADPPAMPAERTALLAVLGGSGAGYFGVFGLTLLIDQNQFFLIESDDFLKNIPVSTNEYICIIQSIVTAPYLPHGTHPSLPPGSRKPRSFWANLIKMSQSRTVCFAPTADSRLATVEDLSSRWAGQVRGCLSLRDERAQSATESLSATASSFQWITSKASLPVLAPSSWGQMGSLEAERVHCLHEAVLIYKCGAAIFPLP